MRLATLALAGALLAATPALPASAKAKPVTISRTYTANAPMPDPSGGACARTVPDSFDELELRLPKGVLSVRATGIVGDWDIEVVDTEGVPVAQSTSSDVGTPYQPTTEAFTARITRLGVYRIFACNFLGGSSVTVTYVFTFG